MQPVGQTIATGRREGAEMIGLLTLRRAGGIRLRHAVAAMTAASLLSVSLANLAGAIL
jgi:hypothetical protein